MHPDASCPCSCANPFHPRRALHRRVLLATGVSAATAACAVQLLGPAPAGAAGRLVRPALPGTHRLTPRVVRRSDWGADEGLRRGPAQYDNRVSKLVVHHTATPNRPADPAEWLRRIYDFQVAGVYTDIAYHFLVDHRGRVYEGRYAREYARHEEPDGEDALGRSVRGAATGGFNVGTVAVALLGDFTTDDPTPAALDALVDVLAWKCTRWGIDPLGAEPYPSTTRGWVAVPNIAAHQDCKVTLCPGAGVAGRLVDVRNRVARRMRNRGAGGYWVITATGRTVAFGDVPSFRGVALAAPIQAAAAHPAGNGYWLAGADGGVFAFGDAAFHGSLGGRRLNAPVTAMAATPTGDGYWLTSADGGVFAFGDAGFHGSVATQRLNSPVLAMSPTPSGRGYWLAGADGGVFAFGDAGFHGAVSHARLNAPVVAIAATPSGRGYWLAGADGGVFAFGDAGFHGSWARRLRGTVVAMVASSSGRGYALLASDGRIAAFGDAPHHGHELALAQPVAIAGRLRV